MKKLLIIEDDAVFATSLVRAMSRRGYLCMIANSLNEARELSENFSPEYITLDLQLGVEQSQSLVTELRVLCPKAIIILLTGFGSIPSAVQAIKDGADFYLSKPATPDEIEQAFGQKRPESDATQLWDLEQEHIGKVLQECGGNITQAAKKLGLHRRTLQRRLKKI